MQKKTTFVMQVFSWLFSLGVTLPVMSDTLKVISPIWPDYVDSDSEGLYIELLNLSLRDYNYEITYQPAPLKRASLLVEKGVADVIPGIYSQQHYQTLGLRINIITSTQAINIEETVAAYLKTNRSKWHGIASLEGAKVVALRGYRYDEIYPVKMHYREVDSYQQALNLLKFAKVDFFIDDKLGLRAYYLQLKETQPENMIISTISSDKLYMAFTNNQRGRLLASQFNQGFTRLKANNKLLPLYEKYNIDFPNFDVIDP